MRAGRITAVAILLVLTACAAPEGSEEGDDDAGAASTEDGASGDTDAGADEPTGDEADDGAGDEADDEAAGPVEHEPCESTQVTMGVLPPSLSNSGIYLAQEKGYFAEQGIELELEQFRSGDDQTASLARGDLDVASGGPSAGLYNAVASGIEARIVADKGYADEDHDWIQFVTTPELHEQGIQTAADFEGRSIGIVGRGASGEVALGRLLQSEGLAMEDVDETVIPFPEMPAALIGGSLDIILPLETMLTRLIEAGDAVPVVSPLQAYPEQQWAVIFYSQQFLEESPDAGLCFMVAYLQGLRDYNDAFFHDEGLDEVKEILVGAGVVEEPDLLDRVNLVGLNPDGYVKEDSIAQDIEYYTENGYLEQETSADTLIDHSFVDDALEILGPYEP